MLVNERKILVAVDFGTTFSGVAWAQTRKPEGIYTIEVWPDENSEGSEGTSRQKVPSEIRRVDGVREWGFQIGEGWRHRWFKLELDPARKPSRLQLARKYNTINDLFPANIINNVVIDYLNALREHTEHLLTKRFNSFLDHTPIEYIITTPAVWSDAAQAKTRKCAEAARMGRGKSLTIVSEPEAAAIYAFDVTSHDIKVGDTFVVCDAGGGTVDLISYTVTATEPILKVDEAAPGMGGLCGSVFLNRIFEKQLVEKCELNPGWSSDILEEAMKRFETIKQQFGGKKDKDFSIPVHGLDDNKDQGVQRGKWNLSGIRLANIFEPVVKETIDLVKDQIKATKRDVTAVLLVGGWGQNAFLRESLRNQLGYKIKVIVPPNGWQAVVRGALMKALAQSSPSSTTMQVGSRVARKHYGTEDWVPLKPGERAQTQKQWLEFEGRYGVVTMHWLIKKGDSVREDRPTIISQYYAERVEDWPPTQLVLPIMCSTNSQGAPQYREDGVQHLVDLYASLEKIPESELDREIGHDGKMWYQVKYDIVMTGHSASTSYVLRYKNQKYGSVMAEYV